MSTGRPGIDTDALLTALTEPQREAVVHADGPLLVLAGAGSGKTRVITRRAAYLASTVARPAEVLAITFTNKASNEMGERIIRLGVGPEMIVCTFHSLCARLLRIYHDRAGLASNFTIFDELDRRAVVKQAVRACDYDPTNWPAPRVLARISQAKNALQTAEAFAEQRAAFWEDRGIAKIYAAYEQLMAGQQAVDFDDLLMKLVLLLQSDQELRDRLEARYRYVLIDEYQDTNDAQYRIAHLLTRDRRNICATGDPDQSIYGWRGANILNILRFERDYLGAAVVRLEQNYRSTKRILSAASSLISANVDRKEKTLWTENAEGDPVRAAEFEDAEDEAEFIANQVAEAIRNGRSPREVAIFYRINALSLPLELALQRAGIAYQIARGQEFYGRREIKDLLAYVRVMVNPADSTSLRRIINTPSRGIGKKTLDKLEAVAERSGRKLSDVVLDTEAGKGLGRSAERVARFAELLRTLHAFVDWPAAKALAEVFGRSGLRASLAGEETVDTVPAENVAYLINEARKYDQSEPDGSLVGWLERASLASDVDTIDQAAGKVTLMTLHASKGLEFPVVYIVGLEDGLLPFFRNEPGDTDEEEERRLCFVGMTRAMQQLTLTHSRYRVRQGRATRNVRSPFLSDLLPDQIDWIDRVREASRGGDGRRGDRLPRDLDQWQVGSLVQHPEHGLGQVIAIRRGGNQTYVGVTFKDGGPETFVLEFAELTRVDFDEVD